MSPPGNLTHSEDASGGQCCTSAPQFGTLMVFCGSHRAPFGSHWSSSHVKTPDYLNWNLSILSNFCPLRYYVWIVFKKKKKKHPRFQDFAIQFCLLVLGQASSLTASVYVLTMDGNMVCGVPRGSMTLSSLLLPNEPRRICRQYEPVFVLSSMTVVWTWAC